MKDLLMKHRSLLIGVGLSLLAGYGIRYYQDSIKETPAYRVVLAYPGRECSPDFEIMQNDEILLLNNRNHENVIVHHDLEEKIGKIDVLRFDQ
ncbi:hypothetical protein HYT57_00245 [Candidatus Woesearchaeota archaeon]|nr:hypothetical protein [Candidatus Woesearchaeota archaeon]